MDALLTVLKQCNPSWDVSKYGMAKKKGFSRLLEQPAVQQYFELKVVDHIKFVREKRRSRD
jgi:hypothetical protein